ncbi:hypothetical protein ACWGJ2_40440, partial [Streptomyces sp. NPDC054796]
EQKTRNYENHPEVQGLRWISTVTRKFLADNNHTAIEVQAALGSNGKLILAATDSDSNYILVDLLEKQGVEDLLGHMLAGAQPARHFAYMKPEERARADRTNRHLDAARGMHNAGKSSQAHAHQGITTALSAGVVIAARGGSGRHAERRILAYNDNQTPKYLGGTKRPCATCFQILYPEAAGKDLDDDNGAVRPGRFNSSWNANLDVPEYEDTKDVTPKARAQSLFDRIDKAVPRTYASRTRSGAVVRDVDSDSE